MGTNLGQRQRIAAFIINALLFYAVYAFVNAGWSLTGGGETIWLVAAVAWWTLSLLSAPWYRPPRDALAAGVAAAIALLAIDFSSLVEGREFVATYRLFALAYVGVVIFASLLASMTDDTSRPHINRAAYDLANRLSSGPLIFGGLAAISIFGFYLDLPSVLGLTLLWLFWALIRPVEFAFEFWNRMRSLIVQKSANYVGKILRVDDPEIVRVAIEDPAIWRSGLHVATLPGNVHRHCLPLFYHTQDENVVGTGLLVGEPISEGAGHPGSVVSVDDPALRDALLHEIGGEGAADLVGFVVEGSSITEIRFEIAKSTIITEGSVLFCRIRGEVVYYQVMEANTAEESFQQNPRGTHIVTAAQLGMWEGKSGFEKHSWLPKMNSPVFLPEDGADEPLEISEGEFEIGKVPNSSLAIKADLPKLINFHTAILGVTGTGKTELTFSLIEEAIKQGTKIICVDLTGEYRKRLEHLRPQGIGLKRERAQEIEDAIFAVDTGEFKAGAEKKILKRIIEKSRDDARRQVSDFLRAPGSSLGLFELAEVTNTRATLIATEMYLSEIMLWARSHRKSRRILIVLEEAHTIIPETSGSGLDFETQLVVSKIGQIALQGRKYGVGLFIVSQRTALVSKTVLSQCNTFLTHSLIDQTSLHFLLNIYDSSYVKAIPNLKFLNFIASGQGIVSDRPVLLCRPFDQEKADASAQLDEYTEVDVEIPAEQSEVGIAKKDGGPRARPL